MRSGWLATRESRMLAARHLFLIWMKRLFTRNSNQWKQLTSFSLLKLKARSAKFTFKCDPAYLSFWNEWVSTMRWSFSLQVSPNMQSLWCSNSTQMAFVPTNCLENTALIIITPSSKTWLDLVETWQTSLSLTIRQSHTCSSLRTLFLASVGTMTCKILNLTE